MHCMALVTPRFLSPISTVSAKTRAWDHDRPPRPFGVHTREKEEEEDDDDDDDVTVVLLESRC